MQFKLPKNNERYLWTLHSIEKMQFYGLSEQKVLGIIRRPKRKEEGIVKNTIAVMQPVSPKVDGKGMVTWKTEIWAMYQLRKARKTKAQRLMFKNLEIKKLIQNSKLKIENSANQQIRIISAWRYPGVSPKNNPIPEDILREISESVI
jgi:hypothetical protein